jgi:Polysaccharide deacetylase
LVSWLLFAALASAAAGTAAAVGSTAGGPTASTPAIYAPLPAYTGVPVLNYHAVTSTGATGEAVSTSQFAAQMAMLSQASFHSITIAQYVAWLQGEGRLPSHPILITFDDGRLDSWRGAEATLNRYHLHAVMFAIVGKVGTERFFLSWRQLREMAASGRWDIQFHANRGHVRVPIDAKGDVGPWYANELKGETFAAYKHRVETDILTGLAKMRAEIPGFKPLAMAWPYGSYGQCVTNDPRIPRFLGPWMATQVSAVFTGNPEQFTTPQMPRYRLGRLIITSRLTAPRMYSWLRAKAKPKAKPAPICAANTKNPGG